MPFLLTTCVLHVVLLSSLESVMIQMPTYVQCDATVQIQMAITLILCMFACLSTKNNEHILPLKSTIFQQFSYELPCMY